MPSEGTDAQEGDCGGAPLLSIIQFSYRFHAKWTRGPLVSVEWSPVVIRVALQLEDDVIQRKFA